MATGMTQMSGPVSPMPLQSSRCVDAKNNSQNLIFKYAYLPPDLKANFSPWAKSSRISSQ
jgi:hypothetical protein